MDYRYTYLLMGILTLIIWAVLYIWRADNRKEMLMMSCIFAVIGPITDFVYTRDWWHPLTITNTVVGIESIIVGFFTGGVASVLYEDIFRKQIKSKKLDKTERASSNFELGLTVSVALIIFLTAFFLLGLNSLIATVLAGLVPLGYIWFKRNDLIFDSIVSGLLLFLCASIVYTILNLITPGWVQAFWYFKNVPAIIVLNVPIDDIVWYVLGGMYVGPLYEFWKGGKLINYTAGSHGRTNKTIKTK